MHRSNILRQALLIALLLRAAAAQNPADLFSKAPPDVDQALRERISKFYQAHVDGKPRRAEEIVAEDSKDFFYNMKKPKFLGFEIHNINYSKDFTQATVVVLVETVLPMIGFGNKPMKVPATSLWKIENGLWCWYVTDDFINTTPFGKMGSPPGQTASGNPSNTLPDMKSTPTPESLWQQVKANKSRVVLETGRASSDQVTIQNQMPGFVTLELHSPPVEGLEVKLDRTKMAPGEKAIVSFHYEPGKNTPNRSVRVHVVVQPINRIIPLQITFK